MLYVPQIQEAVCISNPDGYVDSALVRCKGRMLVLCVESIRGQVCTQQVAEKCRQTVYAAPSMPPSKNLYKVDPAFMQPWPQERPSPAWVQSPS